MLLENLGILFCEKIILDIIQQDKIMPNIPSTLIDLYIKKNKKITNTVNVRLGNISFFPG